MRMRFFKTSLAFVLCVAVALNCDCLGLYNNASASSFNSTVSALFSITVEHKHSLKATAVDKTSYDQGFWVDVNVANTTSIWAFCNEPVSWTLEWQALRADRTVYTSGNEVGIFLSTVASNTKSVRVPALKYGYLKFRLRMVSHGVVTYSVWGECEASTGGGGGGQHRIGAA